jgi:ABC-type lipoprotein release transport system permease subunit
MRRLLFLLGLAALLCHPPCSRAAGEFSQDLAALSAAPHRLAGTPEGAAAAEHLRRRLEEIGLDAVLVQEFPTVQLLPGRTELVVDGAVIPLRPLRANGIVPPLTPPGGLSGRLLHAGRGELADYGERSPEGAIVVLDYDTGDTWLQAFRLGARAVIFTGRGRVSSRHALHVHANANLPRFYHEGDPAELREGAVATLHAEARWTPVVARNVIGFLRGTAPVFHLGREEALVLAAPLDSFGEVPSLSPAARGAANLAGLLATAERLRADRPRRHVVFAFLDNEARGFEGSRAFYRAIDRHQRDPGASLEARRESLDHETAFLGRLSSALGAAHPLLVEGPAATPLLNRVRLAADEQIEISRAEAGDLRSRIRRLRREAGEDFALGPRLEELEAALAAREEPHQRWNTFRRELARGRLGPPEAGSRHAETLDIVRAELAEREAELALEERAWAADRGLRELLGEVHIVAHLSTVFGDDTTRWGLVFGGSSRLGTPRDAPGFYGRVFQVFKEAGDSGGQAPGFDPSPLDPNRLLFGGAQLVHGGVIAGRHGIYNLVAATAHDPFVREGTPDDLPARLAADRVAAQMAEFAGMIRRAADADALSAGSPIVRSARQLQPRFRDNRIHGALIMRRTPGSSVANRAAAGAIVQLFPADPGHFARGAHEFLAWQPAKFPAHDDFIVARANANGAIAAGPLDSTLPFRDAGFAALFDARGEVVAVNDIDSTARVASRLNLFAARGGAVVVPPHLAPGPGRVLDARSNSPLDPLRNHFGNHDGLVFWFVEPRVAAVKVFGAQSAVELRIGDDLLSRERHGTGIATGGDAAPRGASIGAARDLVALNEERLEQMRRRGVTNGSVEALHARASDLLERAADSPRVAEREALAASAFLSSLPVYEAARANLDDLVKAVLVLLALAVPFSVALERLLIGAATIYGRIGGFAGFFACTFLVLYLTHPAFAVSNAPMIIFLGFAIVVLSVLVIGIIMRKFETELKRMQGMAATVHAADVSRFGTLLAAMSMGISSMRRRPMRTALTATTVVLLTFTILCFASFGGELGVRLRFLAPLPEHQGFVVHRMNWGPLDAALPGMVAAARSAEDEATVTTRHWSSSDPRKPGHTALARADGSRPVPMQGVLGLQREELALRPDLREVLGAPDDDFERSVWISAAVARALEVGPGDEVRLNGRRLRVAALVDAGRLAALRDMNGASLLPVDFLSLEGLAVETGAADGGGALNAAWDTLPPDSVAIVSTRTARELFAPLRAITVYTRDTAVSARLAEDAARVFRSPVAGTREDGVYWHVFGSTLAAAGLGDLLMPLLLGGLVVFGTMLGSVADRGKEIHTFSALGLAPPHVASLFFAEALVFSVIGGLGGYLTAQGVMALLHALAGLGWVTPPEINYSSTNAILTILIVMATVLVSAIYPALKASRGANPGLLRAWRLPEPEGDVMQLTFPFTVSTYDITGVVSFLKEHFDHHQDTGLGLFISRDTRLLLRDGESPGLSTELALAPFDLGVTQSMELRAAPGGIPGIDEVYLTLVRRSGQPKDWRRLNQRLLDDLRKQFLIWRSLPADVMESYRERTLAAPLQTAAARPEEELS